MFEKLKAFFDSNPTSSLGKPLNATNSGRRVVVPLGIMSKISYSIVTAPRKQDYLDRTISSLERTGFFGDPINLPLRLISGSPEPHLEKFKEDKRRFLVDEMTDLEAKESHWHASGLGLRASKGHRRAMHPFRSKEGSIFTVIFEEDVSFSMGWQKHLEKSLSECISKYGDRFLLSLYTPESNEPLEAFRSGKMIIQRRYGPYGFYGVQGVVWPSVIREAFMYDTSARPIDQERGPGRLMDRAYEIPHDMTVRDSMERLKVPILATAPCLIQHIGTISGAETSGYHKSKSFLESVE